MDREREGGVGLGRLLGVSLGLGLVFNVIGWVGNNLLLDADWDAANAGIKAGFVAPWPGLVRELVTLISDFVYAFALVWLFANSARRSEIVALQIALALWTVGVGLLYLVLVNSGFLPAGVAVKTSLLALAIFLAAAPALPVLVGPARR